jgi:hypothetical protein
MIRDLPWWLWAFAAGLVVLIAMLGLFLWVIDAPYDHHRDYRRDRDNWRH